jgi:hypothetical protein
MIFSKARIMTATVVAAGGLALLTPGSPALAFISPPLVLLGQALSPSYLVASGAAVDVTVEYSCTADSMYIGVQLTEKVGNKIASGSGATSIPCDAATHTTVIRVPANPAGVAFAKGTAVADTSVSGCRVRSGHYLCGSDLVSRTVAVRK